MQINKMILALLALVASNRPIGAYSTLSNKPLVDISGMVKELNPNDLGLFLRCDDPALGNDWFGGYCHLYAKNYLLASAPAVKCFLFQNNLIVFLGDADGYIELVKVFKNFAKNHSQNMTPLIYKPRQMPASAYKPVGFLNPPVDKAKPFDYDLLSDIEMVKLNSSGVPIAMMKVHDGRDVIILHTYDNNLKY